MSKNEKLSQIKIEKAFIELIQTKEINEIKVTDLVSLAKVNRSTFYVNYIDIYDLADKMREKMYNDVLGLYKEEAIRHEHSYNYLKLFKHIKENQIYYKTMFKLNFDFMDYCDNPFDKEEAIKYLGTDKNLEYHIEFFRAGISAIIRKWLLNNCKESPDEMVDVIKLEYKGKR